MGAFRRARRRDLCALVVIWACAVALLALVAPSITLTRVEDLPRLNRAAAVVVATASADEAQLPAPPPSSSASDGATAAGSASPVPERGDLTPAPRSQPAPTPAAQTTPRSVHQPTTASPQGARPPPPSPEALVASPQSDRIELTWAGADDGAVIAWYEVRRDGGTALHVTEAALTDDTVRPGTEYCYTVEAVDAAGNHSPAAGPACAMTRDVVAPTTPTSARAQLVGRDAVLVSWSRSIDDSGQVAYEVWYDATLVATVDATSWMHTRPEARRDWHCYTLRAIDPSGNCSAPSESACVAAADHEPPTAPAEVVLSPQTPDQIALTWSASTDNVGVHRYEVLADDAVAVEARSTSAQVIDLTEDVQHCFSVRAVDAAGNRSQLSPKICGRTLPWSSMPEWKRQGPVRRVGQSQVRR